MIYCARQDDTGSFTFQIWFRVYDALVLLQGLRTDSYIHTLFRRGATLGALIISVTRIRLEGLPGSGMFIQENMSKTLLFVLVSYV